MNKPSPRHLRERLLRHFSPSRVRLGDGGELPLGGGRQGVEYLVGREFCLFLRVDAARVPARQRRDFVALAVRRAAPFPDPEIELAWQGDEALAWYWSASRVRAMAPALGRRDRFRAEAVFVGAAREQGAEWLPLARGGEARLWREGRLVASRWWPQPPPAADWERFVRGSGFEPVPLPAAAADAPVLPAPRPWVASGGGATSLGRQLAGQWPALRLAAGVLLALGFAWQIGAGLRAWMALAAAETRAAGLEGELEPILRARESAESSLARLDSLLALRPPAPQLRLMAEAARVMEGQAWQPNLWAQPNPDTLEVRFSAQGIDAEAVVAAWEASPYFSEVSPTLAPRGDMITLRARVSRPAPPEAGGAVEAAGE